MQVREDLPGRQAEADPQLRALPCQAHRAVEFVPAGWHSEAWTSTTVGPGARDRGVSPEHVRLNDVDDSQVSFVPGECEEDLAAEHYDVAPSWPEQDPNPM